MVRSDSVAPPAPADDHTAGLVRALLLGAAEQATIGVAPAVTPALGVQVLGAGARAWIFRNGGEHARQRIDWAANHYITHNVVFGVQILMG